MNTARQRCGHGPREPLSPPHSTRGKAQTVSAGGESDHRSRFMRSSLQFSTAPSIPLSRCGLRIIALSLFFLGCSSTSAQEQRAWEKSLASGFVNRDPKPLGDFLESWHAQSKPVGQEMLRKKPAVERVVYDLYGAFFVPGGRSCEASGYVIVQDEVEVVIVDADLRNAFMEPLDRESLVRTLPTISHLVLRDFRPALAIQGKKVLYLDAPHLSAMVGFLTGQSGDRVAGRYWNEESNSPERRQRLEYLNTALRILPGHWGTGWHFTTHPYVRSIYFSSSLDRALVCYRSGYGGGDARMERDGERWKILRMEDTWVE